MTPTELQQFLHGKLRKAYNLGQTYWQQADSEYRRDHKKADETAAKFSELVENVVLAVKFEMDRAATEAAKATGTAELPPPDYMAGTKGMLCEDTWVRETVEAYGQACAEAARQPAAAVTAITPDWPACNPACDYEDPRGIMHDNRSTHCNCDAAKESICRQRALAATAAPVVAEPLTTENIACMGFDTFRILQGMEPHTYTARQIAETILTKRK